MQKIIETPVIEEVLHGDGVGVPILKQVPNPSAQAVLNALTQQGIRLRLQAPAAHLAHVFGFIASQKSSAASDLVQAVEKASITSALVGGG